MEIDYLIDHQEFVPILAQWHYDEWKHLRPGDSVDARISRLRAGCTRCQIPTVVIAYSDGTLLGSAMLVSNDMEAHMELSPWLAGLFVAPQERRKGIGGALVRRIIKEAELLRTKQVYLYTPNGEEFYSHLGWSLIERGNYRGTAVAVMSCSV